MKKVYFMSITLFLLHSCCKKTETPDNSALILGKWVFHSYKDDGSSIIENKRTGYLSFFYVENGWEFLASKKMNFKNTNIWSSMSGNYTYSLLENRDLILSHTDTFDNSISTSNYQIIELTNDKLTVHSDGWKSTFFFVRE
jgi:hypothetical protein